ncbi:hypothetical protein OOK34_08875 [Streptomyces sp. NBC_00091]|nr:hypothetical protein [Streptomyces sp. NBC_00091]
MAKAVFAGLGLLALVLALSLSRPWLYGVGAALLVTSVAVGVPRGGQPRG